MEKRIKICPKCGSINIELERISKSLIGITPPTYRCKKCGLTQKIFPEIEIGKIEEFRKKIKNAKHNKNKK